MIRLTTKYVSVGDYIKHTNGQCIKQWFIAKILEKKGEELIIEVVDSTYPGWMPDLFVNNLTHHDPNIKSYYIMVGDEIVTYKFKSALTTKLKTKLIY